MVYWKSFKRDQEALDRLQEMEAKEIERQEGELEARFLECFNKSSESEPREYGEEFERASNKPEDEAASRKRTESIDDALIRSGKSLLPKIDELWSLILAGSDDPLKLRTADDLRQCALDILQDNPQKWLPISEQHLRESRLYNPAPERAARTFRENLLHLVLETFGHSVVNARTLIKSLNHP